MKIRWRNNDKKERLRFSGKIEQIIERVEDAAVNGNVDTPWTVYWPHLGDQYKLKRLSIEVRLQRLGKED